MDLNFKKISIIGLGYVGLPTCSAFHDAGFSVCGIDIDQGVILICTVDGLYQDFKIAGNLLKSYQQKFLQRVDKFYEQIK